MPLAKIKPEPGLYTDGTRYSAEGTWYDADKVRFRKGFAEKIGGWAKYISSTYLGTARKLHDWVTNSGGEYVGVGTNLKLYMSIGDAYYDITPIRETVSLGTDPIAEVSGTAVLTVTCPSAHDAVVGDYVTLAGSDALDGITAAQVNTEHRVFAVGASDDSDPTTKFRILAEAKATSTDTAIGGSSVTAAFQINSGLDTYVSGSGWGAGAWGSGSYGSVTGIGQSGQLRIWSMVNFGDDMLACVRQGDVYYWDETISTDGDGVNTRAKKLSEITRRTVTLAADPITTASGGTALTITDNFGHGAGVGDIVTISGVSGAIGGIAEARFDQEYTVVSTPTRTTFTVDVGGADASSTASGGGSAVLAVYQAGAYYTPTAAMQVMISDVARHVICLGCNPIGSTSINPLFVRWSSSENASQWQPLSTNSAGGQELSQGSEIMGGISYRQEILIWTDNGIVSMRYIGSPFYFSFTEIAKGMSMASPNSAVTAAGSVYFMDRGEFYIYAGSVKRLPCPVLSTVFDDFDISQRHKVFAGSNPDFSEVWWLYPSESGDGENDKYVIYNYEENIWYTGTMVRGAWTHGATKDYPIATSIRKNSLANSFATTNTSGTITISDTAHDLRLSDKVIFQNVSTVGGITAEVLNNEHTVASIPTSDSYTVTLGDLATSTVSAGGGSLATGNYPNVIYNHEYGHDDDGTALTAYIETADMDLGEGDQFWFLKRLIPDIKFRDGDSSSEVTLSINGHDYPASAQSALASATITSSTEQAHIRGRARQISMKVQSTGAGYGWRVGDVRLDARTDGKR
tara:strand:- start:363 stop:2762 length:2400 start_codon:yes stop_codon:yes gene_type:complete